MSLKGSRAKRWSESAIDPVPLGSRCNDHGRGVASVLDWGALSFCATQTVAPCPSGGSDRPEDGRHRPVNGLSGCAQEAGLISGYHSVLKRRIHLSEETVRNVVPVLHGLPAAEGCGVKGVQDPALTHAMASGHRAGRRLNGRDGGPVPRPTPWVAG